MDIFHLEQEFGVYKDKICWAWRKLSVAVGSKQLIKTNKSTKGNLSTLSI